MTEPKHMLINMPAFIFEDPAGNKYTQLAYRSACSVPLIPAPHKNYSQVLSLVPDGFRISNLEEVEYSLQREEELRKGRRNPREVLKDPMFARRIRGNPYIWMHSNIALCAPEGRSTIPVETYKNRRVGIVDYKVGNRIVARDVRVPVSRGGKIVAMNRVLRIPVDVSDGIEPQHVMHWFFDPEHYDEKNEVAVRLGGGWSLGERGRCLRLAADVGRSYSASDASFRLVQGSLDEVPLLQVEYTKDRENREEVADATRQEIGRAARGLTEFFQQLRA